VLLGELTLLTTVHWIHSAAAAADLPSRLPVRPQPRAQPLPSPAHPQRPCTCSAGALPAPPTGTRRAGQVAAGASLGASPAHPQRPSRSGSPCIGRAAARAARRGRCRRSPCRTCMVPAFPPVAVRSRRTRESRHFISHTYVQRARSADYTVNLTHLTHTFLPSRHARNIGTLSTTAVICVVHELRAAQQQSLRRAAPQFSINQHPPFSPLPVAPTLQLVLILSSCGGGLPDREKQALSAARWQVGDVARARESIGDLLRL
jgi:hypothetical protein